tara:strand:- start:200 stop:484 length:285 start_codon:yes stop_codon:yes gene_type:complete
MTAIYKQITWSEFEDKFSPVTDTNGNYWLDAHGPDLLAVMAANPANVFTIVDGGGRYIDAVSGYKFVDRLNYVLTANAVEAGATYYVTNSKGVN